MKIVMMIVAALVLLGLVAYVVMAVKSQKTPPRFAQAEYLKQGQLFPCPDSPNCVCSEQHTASDEAHFISPIQGSKATFTKLKSIILLQGGSIVDEQEDYVYATFSTAIFRYMDDIELRFDAEHQVIHLRSASRMGRSDFGVNRSRMEQIKAAL